MNYSIIMRLSDVDELNTWASGQQVNHQRSGYGGATVWPLMPNRRLR